MRGGAHRRRRLDRADAADSPSCSRSSISVQATRRSRLVRFGLFVAGTPVARRLGEPLLIGRLERDLDEPCASHETAVILAQNGTACSASTSSTPPRSRRRPRGARPSLPRAHSSPSSLTVRRDEPPLIAVPHDRNRCGPESPTLPARNGEEMVLRPRAPASRAAGPARRPSADAPAIRPGFVRHARSRPSRTQDRLLWGGLVATGLDDPDRCANGRISVSRFPARERPEYQQVPDTEAVADLRPVDLWPGAVAVTGSRLARRLDRGSDRGPRRRGSRSSRMAVAAACARAGSLEPAPATSCGSYFPGETRSRASCAARPSLPSLDTEPRSRAWSLARSDRSARNRSESVDREIGDMRKRRLSCRRPRCRARPGRRTGVRLRRWR